MTFNFNLKTKSFALANASVLITGLVLAGCGGGNNSTAPIITPAAAMFEITVVNATNNQPLSPVAVIMHDNTYSAWSVGSKASVEIEYIAEGGSNKELLASLASLNAKFASGKGAIFPGKDESVTITPSSSSQSFITIATMLINTNDAFAGINAVDVSNMSKGDSISLNAKIYDAGTEMNTESVGTMPGPADKGEGFNSDRTDFKDVVRSHGGVVTKDDGLGTSVLNQSHRFDNPGMIVTITKK